MIFGLPIGTFLLTFVLWAAAIVAALIYGLTYRDDDDWWTIDSLFEHGKGADDEK